METNLQIIDSTIKELANIKINQDYTKAEIERMELEISRTALAHAVELAKQTMAELKVEEQQARTTLDAAALGYHDMTGLKDVHDAVKVKTFTLFEFDPGAMFDYAMAHRLAALLQLNKRTALAMAKTGNISFVDKVTEERVSVSKDLSKYA